MNPRRKKKNCKNGIPVFLLEDVIQLEDSRTSLNQSGSYPKIATLLHVKPIMYYSWTTITVSDNYPKDNQYLGNIHWTIFSISNFPDSPLLEIHLLYRIHS